MNFLVNYYQFYDELSQFLMNFSGLVLFSLPYLRFLLSFFPRFYFCYTFLCICCLSNQMSKIAIKAFHCLDVGLVALKIQRKGGAVNPNGSCHSQFRWAIIHRFQVLKTLCRPLPARSPGSTIASIFIITPLRGSKVAIFAHSCKFVLAKNGG